MPYEVNPREYGYYWATRFTDEKKIYSFSPNNLPQNAETSVDRDGQYFSAKGVESWPGPYGMQGQLWSEIVRTDEQMEYMIYPRLLALAERAWHKAEWKSAYVLDREYVGRRTNYVNQQLLNKNWQDFANLIAQKELPKLDKAGIQYRLPVPGARIQNGMLEMNISLPGLPMEYSKDAGATWQVYREPIPVDGAVFVRSTSWDKSRTSRVEEISFP